MNKQHFLLFPLVLVVVGCASPVPIAQNFPVSFQKVARTAHHWDVVAQDVVAQTNAAIEANPVLQKRGIFVSEANTNTAFNVAFRDFLINHMVGTGLPVSVCKSTPSDGTGFAMDGTDVEVHYEARIIGHGARTPHYVPGALTALAAGVKVIHNISENMSDSSQWAAGIGLAVLTDVAASNLSSPTRTELIVTTTISENNRYIMRRSDIYYVPDADAQLFVQRVNKHSPCVKEKTRVSKADSEPNAADLERSRRAMMDREMKRWSPGWQSQNDAYAY